MSESQAQDGAVVFTAIEPARDLWPGIEAAMSKPVRSVSPWRRLAPVGFAASLLLAFSLATQMTVQQVAVEQSDRNEIQRIAQLMQVQQRAEIGAVASASAERAVKVNPIMDSLLAAELEIYLAIDNGGTSPALLDMLAYVHRRQLEMMNHAINVRDYT